MSKEIFRLKTNLTTKGAKTKDKEETSQREMRKADEQRIAQLTERVEMGGNSEAH